MKTGRNDPCPCGSGKKYKKCCLQKNDMQRLAEAVSSAQATLKRDGQIKQCLYPDKTNCSSKIIKAHALQNNRILTKIAENGLVTTLDGTSNLIFQDSQQKGRKIATTFTGFCSYHDKVLFQDIEDCDFIATTKQVFLLTYRTMAWHYHKKEEQLKRNQIFQQNMLSKGYRTSTEFIDAVSLGVSDNKIKKELFDSALLSSTYDMINYSIWEIPYEVNFAVSMQHEPIFDILGNKVNDYKSNDVLKSIYLNIFPASGNSYCIWSWLSTDNSIFHSFSKQFMDLGIVDRENYLNNNLPVWTDSIVISPKLWRKWGNAIQQSLIIHANMESLYLAHELEDNGHPYEYMDTPWNFFDIV